MRFANDVLRFLLELAALAAQAYWGATADTPLWPLIAVGAPLVVAAFWGRFMSPKAPRRHECPASGAHVRARAAAYPFFMSLSQPSVTIVVEPVQVPATATPKPSVPLPAPVKA